MCRANTLFAFWISLLSCVFVSTVVVEVANPLVQGLQLIGGSRAASA